MKLFINLIFLILSPLLVSISWGQDMKSETTALPSSSKVQKEMQRIEVERKAMFDANNPEIERKKNNFPNIPTPPVSTVDIQTIAKKYEQRADIRKTDELMIFVSFTMPAESLKRIILQAHQVGAAVIINGFKANSLKTTTNAIKQLGEAGGNVIINPNAFTKYEIKAVPTIVLAKPETLDQLDSDGCALPNTYVSVAGDVSLDYALNEISKRDAQFSLLATRYHRQLKGN